MDEQTTEQSSDGRTWVSDGWTARVQKNEDDEGWAVAMTRDGDAEPVLVSPWTMGRDKKNPKPLNTSDFKTLLKAARDVVARHEAHQRAMLHKSVTISDKEFGIVRVDLDIVPDEDDPRAILTAWNRAGDKLGERVVSPSFNLSSQAATKWAISGFGSD